MAHRNKPVNDIRIFREYGTSIVWLTHPPALVTLRFEKEWMARIEVLRVGEIISIEGKIDKVVLMSVELRDCRLIGS
jgi:hypothetical protein